MANAIVVYNGTPKPNSWARWMVGRTMRANKNNLIALVGKTGSGKTWSAISICEIMSKMDGVPFTIHHIVFSLRELMELINSGKLIRGSKVVFDEPQVSISAREFQSTANKVFNYLVSTFRHRNLSLFFCTPFENLLDKNTRKLFHAKFETLTINNSKKTCRLKPRFLECHEYKDKIYRKRLIIVTKDGSGGTSVDKLMFWDVPAPSKGLIALYEAKKKAFTDNLNQNIMNQLQKYDNTGKSMTAAQKDRRKPLTEKQKEAMIAKAVYGWEECARMMGITSRCMRARVKAAEKKGYSIKEFKESPENNEKT